MLLIGLKIYKEIIQMDKLSGIHTKQPQNAEA